MARLSSRTNGVGRTAGIAIAAVIPCLAAGCTYDPQIPPPGFVTCSAGSKNCPSGYLCTDVATSGGPVWVCCATPHCANEKQEVKLPPAVQAMGGMTGSTDMLIDAAMAPTPDGAAAPTDVRPMDLAVVEGPAPVDVRDVASPERIGPQDLVSAPAEPAVDGRVADSPRAVDAPVDVPPDVAPDTPADSPMPPPPPPMGMCGNSTVETGETCDPPSACPTACPQVGCTKRMLEGDPAKCTARCVEAGMQTACVAGDSCCPATCNATSDGDCKCTCGNGTVESSCGETCDPLASCPTVCPPNGCMLKKLLNPGTCQAACVDDRMQTACMGGDGCCPPGCNNNNDSDCPVTCGNSAVETGEQCDPPSSCPATCPWNVCAKKRLDGTAMLCTARCVDDGTQTSCANGDGCCPSGCTVATDNDCAATCGDGVVSATEKCDNGPNTTKACPTTCPNMGCQTRRLDGTAAACSAECVNDTTITSCTSGDGCCGSGCTSANDSDCMCQCGNGAVEAACNEKCEGAGCPSSCPTMGCQTRRLQGTAAACTAECVNDTLIATCTNGDGCCPASGCNNNTDSDCPKVCGNMVVESGEKCDPMSACQTAYDGCVSTADTIKTRTGQVSDCTFECTSMARACSGTSDGFCPSSCTPCGATCGTGQDIDCKLTNGAVCTHVNQCMTACLDGRCCSVASCGTCQACTGTGGLCANIALGTTDTEPANTCTGTKVCNGMGLCKSKDGEICATGTDCASGGCQAVPQDSTNRCCKSPSNSLSNAACDFPGGVPCAVYSNCLSGVCEGGYCCSSSTACGACRNCSNTGSCSTTVLNAEDAGTCSGTNYCNASATCVTKGALGSTCTLNVQCASPGYCVDGRCCMVSSCAGCKRCGATGSCVTTVTNAEDAPKCPTTSYCDASGNCVGDKANGSLCTFNGECASGACTTFYRDGDGDGVVGNESFGSKYCGTSLTGWQTAPGTDCCDTDNRAKPGQTMGYGTARTCGGYDFDCDNVEMFTSTFLWPGCPYSTGWYNTVPTSCGTIGQYVILTTCPNPGVTTEDRAMPCK